MKLSAMQQNTLVLQETRRRFKSHKVLTEASGPLTGAYYWYPKKDMEWEVMPFYDSEYNGNTLHESVWPEMLQAIALEWGLNYNILHMKLRSAYTGLPRGRVSLGTGPGGADRYHILHGDDAPVPNGIRRIAMSFNLTNFMKRDLVMVVPDEHETQLPEDVEAFRRANKIKI